MMDHANIDSARGRDEVQPGAEAWRPSAFGRRRFLVGAIGLGVAGEILAACGGGDDDDTSNVSGTDVPSTDGAPDTTGGSDSTTGASGTTGATQPTAPETTAEPDEAQQGGSFTYLINAQGSGAVIDPGQASGDSDSSPVPIAVFGMLLYDDYESGQVVPWMAESMTATDPGNWVLKLRDGVTFSDGTPYDAEAVKFNWERIGADETSEQAPVVARIASMTVADSQTLNIALVSPDAQFDRTVARDLTYVGSPTAMQDDLESFLRSPVGAGPFVVTSLNSSDGAVELERNPSYWDRPRPYLDTLSILPIGDDQQRYNTFVSEGIQLSTAGANPAVLPQAEAAGYELLEINAPAGGLLFMMNAAQAPFDDVVARRAFQHAVDAPAIVDTVFSGRGRLVTSFFNEDSDFYDSAIAQPAPDPDEAQRLFDEYAAASGGPMTIRFAGPQAESISNLAQLLQAQLASFDNVSMEIELVPIADYGAVLVGGTFSVANFAWTAYDPQVELTRFYGTDGARNFGKYSNPDVDALLESLTVEIDQAERVRLIGEITRILIVDDAIAYYPLQPTTTFIIGENGGGLPYAVNGLPLWDKVWVRS